MKPGWLVYCFLIAVSAASVSWADEPAPYRFVPSGQASPRSGSSTAVPDLSVVTVSSGSGPVFELEYADVNINSGRGFDDPVSGHQRRRVVETVFERISTLLSEETGTARIRLASDSPWLNDQTLAVGIPYFRCVDGFQKPIIFDALRDDIHVHDIEGELLVNFDLPLNASLDPPHAGQYDLYTILLHEAVHILGFVGFAIEPDGRPTDCGGARMLPSIARIARSGSGNALWVEDAGQIRFRGTVEDLPGTNRPLALDGSLPGDSILRLASSDLKVSGHWIPPDFENREGVLMLREPFPTGSIRRNLTPETKAVLREALGYLVSEDPRGLTGSWIDPNLDGQGFTLHFIDERTFVIYFFGFRDDGTRQWMLGVHRGAFALGEPLSVPLFEASGGNFNHLVEADISESAWGELQVLFQDCFTAEAHLAGIDGEIGMQLYALARVDTLDCF